MAAEATGFTHGRPVIQVPIVETEPKKTGRPAGAKTSPQAPSRRSLETQIGGTIFIANTFVTAIPALRADALDAAEITALAKAIDLQCRTSPRFRKYVEAALSGGSGMGLLGVCVMIGARRAARHGIIEPGMDGAIGGLIAKAAQVSTPVEA